MEISEFDHPIRGSLGQKEPQDDVSGGGKPSFLPPFFSKRFILMGYIFG